MFAQPNCGQKEILRDCQGKLEDTSLKAETQFLNIPSSIKDGKRGAKVSILLLLYYIALQSIATMVPFEAR